VCISCTSMKKLMHAATDPEIREQRFQFHDEHRDHRNQLGMRNQWSGNTAICKSDYLRAGRMDETYQGYGWADSDMTNRCSHAGIEAQWRPEIELHLWHPPATYGSGDQKQLFINNGLHFCKTWGVPLPPWFREEIARHKRVML